MSLRTILQELTPDDAQAAAGGAMGGTLVRGVGEGLAAGLGRTGPGAPARRQTFRGRRRRSPLPRPTASPGRRVA